MTKIIIMDGTTDITTSTSGNAATTAIIARIKAAETKAAAQLKTLNGTITINIAHDQPFFKYDAEPSTPPNLTAVENIFLTAIK